MLNEPVAVASDAPKLCRGSRPLAAGRWGGARRAAARYNSPSPVSARHSRRQSTFPSCLPACSAPPPPHSSLLPLSSLPQKSRSRHRDCLSPRPDSEEARSPGSAAVQPQPELALAETISLVISTQLSDPRNREQRHTQASVDVTGPDVTFGTAARRRAVSGALCLASCPLSKKANAVAL
ncbi:hypothetical protein EJ04DRAFT_28215 [Polyplosphaeria fusca]|uniref:Uncharacterized protein n=1 Tax=Polyplosphaeria fusca TaxID=682080 RepID=A0A9P4QQP4_9PLEO|nr:hypothetical protein EJ04DRAFT_28215 [Polyplosphaeria fusca]